MNRSLHPFSVWGRQFGDGVVSLGTEPFRIGDALPPLCRIGDGFPRVGPNSPFVRTATKQTASEAPCHATRLRLPELHTSRSGYRFRTIWPKESAAVHIKTHCCIVADTVNHLSSNSYLTFSMRGLLIKETGFSGRKWHLMGLSLRSPRPREAKTTPIMTPSAQNEADSA